MPISLRSQLGGGVGITPNATTTVATSTTNGFQLLGTTILTNVNINNLTTVMSLTGKFAISFIELVGVTISANNQFRIIIIIDGLTISDNLVTSPPASNVNVYGPQNGITASNSNIPLVCRESFVLRLQNTGNTAASIRFNAIPIV